MKAKVLQALEYPRLAAVQRISAQECHRRGYHQAADTICQICPLREDCRWLNSQNDFIALAGKSVRELTVVLKEAIGRTESHRGRMRHNAVACCCGRCLWLREAKRLLKQAKPVTQQIDPRAS